METITYSKLNRKNFSIKSLDTFRRFQEVKECWRKINNEYVLVKNEYIEEWDLNKLRNIAQEILNAIDNNCIVYGAFHEEELIGFMSLSNSFFGSNNQYVEVVMLQVSYPFRRYGIGRKMFEAVCKEAKAAGAKRLYISAHSSKESQAFYRRIGCIEAVEINKSIADNEPFDIQMEYQL